MSLEKLPSVLIVCLLSVCVGGCLPFLRSAKEPLPAKVLADPLGAACTVLLLPGFWDRPKDFDRHGFDDELVARDLSVRLLTADAHVGYYRKRSILEQLRRIVRSERAEGRVVWLAGNSLGGVGALLYARHQSGGHQSDDVAGVLLMAPYLGEPETIEEIRAAGGPLAWAPPETEPSSEEPEIVEAETLDRDEYARETWRWLAAWHRQGGSDGVSAPQIWLAWGEDDDFAGPAELAAQLLPDGQARSAPGGHDWTAWSQNWRNFLDAGALDGCRIRVGS